jgi:hypothetical protein
MDDKKLIETLERLEAKIDKWGESTEVGFATMGKKIMDLGEKERGKFFC